MRMILTLKAYAKINLALDVLFKRRDGYHEVAMIMQSIDLADTVQVTEKTSEITVTTNFAGLSGDHTNLAYRAAALIGDTVHTRRGVHIHLEKNIPLAAGLAGGSADAAAVLKALNRLWELKLTLAELEKIGANLGSDVPFCLRGGTMLATGRGEFLAPLPALPPCYIVLAKLPVGVPTALVYGQYRADALREHPDISGMKSCLEQGDLSGVASGLCNVLESVTVSRHPEIGELKDCMLKYGAMNSLMSGSGPTVFGLTSDPERAEYIAAKLREHRNLQVLVARSIASLEGEDGTAIIAD